MELTLVESETTPFIFFATEIAKIDLVKIIHLLFFFFSYRIGTFLLPLPLLSIGFSSSSRSLLLFSLLISYCFPINNKYK